MQDFDRAPGANDAARNAASWDVARHRPSDGRARPMRGRHPAHDKKGFLEGRREKRLKNEQKMDALAFLGYKPYDPASFFDFLKNAKANVTRGTILRNDTPLFAMNHDTVTSWMKVNGMLLEHQPAFTAKRDFRPYQLNGPNSRTGHPDKGPPALVESSTPTKGCDITCNHSYKH